MRRRDMLKGGALAAPAVLFGVESKAQHLMLDSSHRVCWVSYCDNMMMEKHPHRAFGKSMRRLLEDQIARGHEILFTRDHANDTSYVGLAMTLPSQEAAIRMLTGMRNQCMHHYDAFQALYGPVKSIFYLAPGALLDVAEVMRQTIEVDESLRERRVDRLRERLDNFEVELTKLKCKQEGKT